MRTSLIGTLEVSVVGLGCNNFGRSLDMGESAAVVHAAIESGVTLFDTASNYGEGRSESFLGAALGNERDEVVICTKFGLPVPGWDGSGGASPDYVRRATLRSLRELGTDYIDLLMIHFPDPDTPIGDTLEAMDDLVSEGKVREIGCSNFSAAQLQEAVGASNGEDLARIVCNQVQLSMVHRAPMTDGTLDACRELDVGLIPFYPLGSGILTGKTRRGEEPVGRLRMERYGEFLSDENFDLVDALRDYATQRDLTMVEVALGWLLTIDGVPTVPAGATKPEQVIANARAGSWAPTADDVASLRALVGGT